MREARTSKWVGNGGLGAKPLKKFLVNSNKLCKIPTNDGRFPIKFKTHPELFDNIEVSELEDVGSDDMEIMEVEAPH